MGHGVQKQSAGHPLCHPPPQAVRRPRELHSARHRTITDCQKSPIITKNPAIIRRGEACLARERWPCNNVVGMAKHHGRDCRAPLRAVPPLQTSDYIHCKSKTGFFDKQNTRHDLQVVPDVAFYHFRLRRSHSRYSPMNTHAAASVPSSALAVPGSGPRSALPPPALT